MWGSWEIFRVGTEDDLRESEQRCGKTVHHRRVTSAEMEDRVGV